MVNSVGKIATGNVTEGLGDLGQLAARTGLDVATGGNKKLVDGLSGGLMTSAEMAARGNSSDITRLGVTGAAGLAGGPMAAMAANNAFASGGNFLQAGFAGLTNSQGGEMSFLNDIGSFLNSNPALSQIANNAITGLTQKSAPKVVSQPEVRVVEVPASQPVSAPMSKGMMVGIGAGVVGLIVVLIFAFRRK